MHGGSHLARHHCSGEQLVQLNQFVGCGVKLERNAVQRVPRFHLDHKKQEEEDTESHSCFCSGHLHEAAQERPEDVTQMMRDGERKLGVHYFERFLMLLDFCTLDFGMLCKLKLSAVDQE